MLKKKKKKRLSLTTSSIFRMLRTVSVASVSALMETSKGCTTSSSRMLEIPPCCTYNKLFGVCLLCLTVHISKFILH